MDKYMNIQQRWKNLMSVST